MSMYYLDLKKHNLPHIHVRYGKREAIYQTPGGELLEGMLSSNKEN